MIRQRSRSGAGRPTSELAVISQETLETLQVPARTDHESGMLSPSQGILAARLYLPVEAGGVDLLDFIQHYTRPSALVLGNECNRERRLTS